MSKNKKNISSGHILITLLIVMVVGTIISASAVSWAIDNTLGNSQTQQGLAVLMAAESGIENAMLALLRDPNYTGEVFTVGGATTTITVSGNGEKTIISQSAKDNFSRKLEVTVIFTDNALTITSWKEST